jgi:hypothetical protein
MVRTRASAKLNIDYSPPPVCQSVPRVHKVENIEEPDKKVIRLLRNQGKVPKNYKRNLPKRVKPSLQIRPPQPPQPFVHHQISNLSDWEGSNSPE